MTEIQEAIVEDVQLTPIQNFYKNSHIFITGATGFLGRVLLEKLLRSCPNISTIYIMVRNKKGKNITTRVDELFDDVIFEELKRVCPKFRHKIIGIEGDCCLPDLGLSDQDRQTLISKVDIIFHVAATVRFDEKIKLAVAINVKAPMYLVRMAQQIKNLKAFMHVSTAYTNCVQNFIEERTYPPPMKGEELIKIVDNISDKSMDIITSRLIGKWPNTYTFTKAVAENVIAEEGKGIPAAIFRPSIIISTFKEPIPAWINNMYGPTGICAAAGSGVMRTLQCDASSNGNMVPVDMCTNSLIAAAWEVGTEFEKNKQSCKEQEVPVYHYESSNDQPITWGRFMHLNSTNGVNYPTIRAIWYYSLTLQKNRYAYLFLMFFLHLVPAFLMDTVLLCIGRQPMMLKVYKKIHKFIDVLSYFTTRNFEFQSTRVRNLIQKMSSEDQKIFFCDLKELDWNVYFKVYLKGVRVYLLQDDMKTLDDALVRWRRFELLHKSLKVLFVFFMCRIAWSIMVFLYSLI
ncbi:hypothetical protein WA026_005293 [Henosepilachna vigintioctopunctata]|uniref:Fatty acyl-CoA reductase n=1 Tax=Henosepilachna vigintioctopunctata TaxID=420089 RepID=A0AAW1UV41_9CUCU